MNFNTVDEVIEFVNKETAYKVIDKSEQIFFEGNYYSSEGREYLKKKGFYEKRYLFGKVGVIFNHWHCDGCKEDPVICKKCRALKTIIKSL